MIHLKKAIIRHIIEVLKIPTKKHRNKLVIAIVLALFIIFLGHAILVSKGYTGYFYERFRDISITMVASALIVFNASYVFKDDGKSYNWFNYLIIANLFVLIFVIHVLRLFSGGLLC